MLKPAMAPDIRDANCLPPFGTIMLVRAHAIRNFAGLDLLKRVDAGSAVAIRDCRSGVRRKRA
jgi:hypothetical protein